MYNMKKERKNGFTLLETLIYIGIVAVIVGALVTFTWNILDTNSKNTAISDINSSVRYLTDRLTKEIKNAIDINTSTSNFGVNLTNSGQISLIAAEPNNPTIITVSSSKIFLTQGTKAPIAITPNTVAVTNLIFTNYSAADNSTKNIGFVFNIKTAPSSSNSYSQTSLDGIGAAEIRNN